MFKVEGPYIYIYTYGMIASTSKMQLFITCILHRHIQLCQLSHLRYAFLNNVGESGTCHFEAATCGAEGCRVSADLFV